VSYGVPPSLREAAQLQSDVLTASQLVDAGLTRDTLSSRVQLGQWQRLHRGVYATFSGEPPREAALWAAVLAAGPGAMLSYSTAAEVAALGGQDSGLIHVTIPADRRVVRPAGIALHMSVRALEALHPARLPPQTRIEETVLDLASGARALDDAIGWVTRGLGRRLTTQEKLQAAMELRAKMRWRPELTELLSPECEGNHSILEWRYHRDVERPHGLPTAARQERFRQGSRTGYRDRLYRAFLVAIELDGRAAHPGDERWDDIKRDNAAATGGVITLRYGWLDVTTRPCLVAAEVATVLATRGFTGARPCSANCRVGASVGQYRLPA
jgi:hypothetical protein